MFFAGLRGTTHAIQNNMKGDVFTNPLLYDVIKDPRQVESIRLSLHRCYKSDFASPYTISTMLDATYYQLREN